GVTEALIEEGADITAGRLTVEARHDLLSFSVAGAVTSAENTGIGVGVAVQRAETSTLAAVRGGEEGARTSLEAGSVTVRARTDGVIETISVAGALATQKDQTPQEPSDADQAAKPGTSRFTPLKQIASGGGQQGGRIRACWTPSSRSWPAGAPATTRCKAPATARTSPRCSSPCSSPGPTSPTRWTWTSSRPRTGRARRTPWTGCTATCTRRSRRSRISIRTRPAGLPEARRRPAPGRAARVPAAWRP